MSTTVLSEMVSLTNAQQRVWFMQQLHPQSCLMNIGLILKLVNPVEDGLLREAVHCFIRENESVLLAVPAQTQRQEDQVFIPQQLPLQGAAPDLDVHDFRETADPAGEARAWIARDMQELFDMESGVLTRFAMVQLASGQTWLYIKAHHMGADGAALTYAGREIAVIYQKLSQGEYVPLAAKPAFAGAAERERDYLASGRYEQDARFWEEQFASLSEPLFSVPERSGVSLQSGRWETVIDPGLRSRIDGFCRDNAVTPYHFFLAAAYIWLYRLTGQRDITIGSITSNRTHPEDKTTYGMFANTLAVRRGLDPDVSFAEHCAAVSRQYARMLRHQKYPFNHLVAKLRQRHPELLKIYQVGMEFQAMDSASGGELPYELEPLFSGMIDEELVVHVKDYRAGHTYGLVLEYKLATFEEDVIADWGGRFIRLIEAAAAEPELLLSELPLLSAEEKQRILAGFNPSQEEHSAERTVIGLFREQARCKPDAPAVECGGERMTYLEVAERSEQLARRLLDDGLEPEDVVALLLPRGAGLIPAMLAVMTAGGAYLPIDPDYPEERIRYMIRDSGAELLLSDEVTLQRLAPSGGAGLAEGIRMVTLEEAYSQPNVRMDAVLPEPLPESLAYVIYTSGTSGKPKGVEIEHRGLAHLIGAQGRLMRLSAETRMLQFASSSFDASVAEIFPILCHGGTLVIEPREALLPGEPLLRLIRDRRVNTACLTPSVLAQMAMEPGWQRYVDGLHTVVSAGEACPAEVAAAWGQGRRLINGYGPTEASVWATYQEYVEGEPLHIGRPLGNTQLFLLDENRQPVPPGVTGELYIGGPALARGYRRRPELTAERFMLIDLGMGGSELVRAYRTGDRARYRPDGCFEYAGRLDQQVKIRGHRVELEEIEAVLHAHPLVLQACVLLLEQKNGAGVSLAAYLVPAGSQKPDPDALRSWLGDRLPRYMVPHPIRLVEELPLTASGKVDRERLKTMPLAEIQLQERDVFYDDAYQSALAEIWMEALGTAAYMPTDNFFDQGGDSFRLLHVHRRIRQKWGITLPVPDLFRYPTLMSLAHHLADWNKGAAPIQVTREAGGPGERHTAVKEQSANRKAEMERQKRLRRKGKE
ncbi:non-ribosomal peptide synthetase [Paenibacillus puerhi]|uniref:non-ribosomal peptide synthetase n=1 Tax=Paenibacillus puerhi TaxID=2692622 RepID=UPI00135C0B24|nr:non-ribosomal peptide synthetase [Paenibacillus puerhi]